jgi:hypothetical protein
MTDELIERIDEWWEYDTGNLFRSTKTRILADAKIIEAAEALARQFEIALCELRAFFADFPGVDYNCPDHNAALAVYRAALEARK